MKKNIVIGVLVVTNFMFLVFAFIQKQEAEMHQVEVMNAHNIARQQSEIAEQEAEQAKREIEELHKQLSK